MTGPVVSPSPVALSLAEARRLALSAQGLLGPVPRAGRPAARARAALQRLRAIQLDTISVLARSHELVNYAHAGAVGRAAVERAYWGGGAVEYWAHAACVVPVEDWPWYAARRRAYRARWRRDGSEAELDGARAEVLQILRDTGPITSDQLAGEGRRGPWWDWSPRKRAVERLLSEGRVVCVTRRAWRRVYDLAERALPPSVLGNDPEDAECDRWMLRTAASRMGVGTLDDLADYFRLPLLRARAALASAALTPVVVEGWAQPAWADPGLLGELSAGMIRGRPRPLLLSPFDPTVWYRARALRLFDFHYRISVYTPAEAREDGYFVMPLLAGGRLAGRVDPKRDGSTLIARRVSVEPGAVEHLATALWEAASWVGCDNVVVGEVRTEGLDGAVREAVARRG